MKIFNFVAIVLCGITANCYSVEIECKRWPESKVAKFSIKENKIYAGVQDDSTDSIVHRAQRFEEYPIKSLTEVINTPGHYSIEITNEGSLEGYNDTINILINKIKGADFGDKYLISFLVRDGYTTESKLKVYLCEVLTISF